MTFRFAHGNESGTGCGSIVFGPNHGLLIARLDPSSHGQGALGGREDATRQGGGHRLDDSVGDLLWRGDGVLERRSRFQLVAVPLQVGIVPHPRVVGKAHPQVAQYAARGDVCQTEAVFQDVILTTDPLAELSHASIELASLSGLPLLAGMFSLLLEEEEEASVAHAVRHHLHLFRQQLPRSIGGDQGRVLRRAVVSFDPFQDVR